ncbi:MAG: helix-turn-helix domain-containing protein [Prevotella sp.]|jgi:AraC-like DNA-binding protein|nr:helix-turn-helix domain-containing protein [Prevotella sp.]
MTSVATFFTGFAAAFFAIYSGLLLRMKARTRFQTILGILFAVWAIACTKDLVLLLPLSDYQRTLKTITVVDGYLLITFIVFLFELTMPGWTTVRRLVLTALPFSFFLIAYIITKSDVLLNVYVVCMMVTVLLIVIISFVKARQYIKWVLENYSNIEDVDVSWIYYIIFCFAINFLSWMFIIWYDQPWTDTIYYIGTVLLWWSMMEKTVFFNQVDWNKLDQSRIVRQPTYNFAEKLDEVMEKEKPYLNSDYKLEDLAQRLGTNRTYLSDYLHTTKKMAFYDFINQLRITKKSIPLMKLHPEYSVDQVASASGFNSISTFRRAFQKYIGTTPSVWREQLKSE